MTRAPDCTGCREGRAQLFDLIRRMNRAQYGPTSAHLDKLARLKEKIAACPVCGTGALAEQAG